jgi:hypothetical protein
VPALGWIGTTASISEAGEFIAVVRFESEAAARLNSDRPEQGEWWAETARHFEGDAIFHDCADVDILLDGGSDDAGFVQIAQGHAKDVARVRALNAHLETWRRAHRPDVIGGTVAWHGDGGFTETVYFTSEAEAREGERKPRPADATAHFDEWLSLVDGLRSTGSPDPWFQSAVRVTS